MRYPIPPTALSTNTPVTVAPALELDDELSDELTDELLELELDDELSTELLEVDDEISEELLELELEEELSMELLELEELLELLDELECDEPLPPPQAVAKSAGNRMSSVFLLSMNTPE